METKVLLPDGDDQTGSAVDSTVESSKSPIPFILIIGLLAAAVILYHAFVIYCYFASKKETEELQRRLNPERAFTIRSIGQPQDRNDINNPPLYSEVVELPPEYSTVMCSQDSDHLI